MAEKLRIGIIASGSGTNLQALIDACQSNNIHARIVIVISDKADAYALDRARAAGIQTSYIRVGRNGSPEYDNADSEQVRELLECSAQLVCMAGYMRRIGPKVLAAFPHAVMNIHPAMLPSFMGAHGPADAAEYGVKIAGCTVHFADNEFDRGPIIIQAAVPVFGGDDGASLAARILEQEHKIYPQAIQWFAEGRLQVEGRKVRLLQAKTQRKALVSPPLEI